MNNPLMVGGSLLLPALLFLCCLAWRKYRRRRAVRRRLAGLGAVDNKITISMRIKPEVKELLEKLTEQLASIDASLKAIKTFLAEGWREIFEVSAETPGPPGNNHR